MISIFEFSDYKDFLSKALFPKGLYRQDTLNLRKLTKKMGYKSPSLLTMVLRGDRYPSFEFVERLAKEIKLTKRERRYLHLLISLDKKKSKGENLSDILREIESIQQKAKTTVTRGISLAQFDAISQWYYLVIKQLISSPEFIEDPVWIRQKLRSKVTSYQIVGAIKNLLKIGAVKRQSNGKLCADSGVKTPTDTPSAAIRLYHQGMLDRAKEALEEQGVQERDFQGLTLRFDVNKMAEAKSDIDAFIEQFNEKYFKPESTDIYQLNLQLFSHTSNSQYLGERRH